MLRTLAIAACVILPACGPDALPPQVTIEEVVATLAPPVREGAVIRGPSPDAVRLGPLQPEGKRPGSTPRESLLAPPPTSVSFRLDVPPDALLRFSIGVAGDGQRDRTKSGLHFRVVVDGVERFSHTLNPAGRRSHRQWVDGSVALDREAGRTVDAVFETSAEDPALELAGSPGWSHVRLMRRTTRDRQRATPGRPNLLLLLVDTLRADRVGTYGARPSPSPTLDALAGRGLVFEDSVSQSSWTMPSVASILTGLHPRSHGAPPMFSPVPDGVPQPGFLADSLLTWPELAQEAGLTTVGVSANPIISRGTNLAQGFEVFTELPWDAGTYGWHPATEVNRLFLDWLDRHRAWRFVAYLHYMEPHDPYAPPAPLRPAPPSGLDPRLVAGDVTPFANAVNFRGAAPLPPETISYLRQLYDGEIQVWDQTLAALLANLRSRGLLESTVVIVTADHGEEFQEHGRLKHGSHLYEESIRVPLVIAGPGVSIGRRTDTAQGIDLFPTIARLLGLTLPEVLPGRDLLATEVGPHVVTETASGIVPGGGATDVTALRTPQWKFILTARTGATELYDLQNDRGEHSSLPMTTQATDLRKSLDRWATLAPPAPRSDGSDPALPAKLRALGYVQ